MRICFLIAELAGRWDEGETELLDIAILAYISRFPTDIGKCIGRRVIHSSPVKEDRTSCTVTVTVDAISGSDLRAGSQMTQDSLFALSGQCIRYGIGCLLAMEMVE